MNRWAKDLGGVYPYDVELMAKVGEAGCLDAGSTMLARCLAIMQHCRVPSKRKSNLHNKITDLERRVRQLSRKRQPRMSWRRKFNNSKKPMLIRTRSLMPKSSSFSTSKDCASGTRLS